MKAFMRILRKEKSENHFDLIAYCLMSNHVHLIIRTGETPLCAILQHIESRYAIYFNTKYERSGHLFSNIFYSKPVETVNVLLKCVSYVHLNPVKAGIVKNPKDYVFSSFSEYLGISSLTDTEILQSHFSDEEIISMHYSFKPKDSLEFLESEKKLTATQKDELLLQRICGLSGQESAQSFQKFRSEHREEADRIIISLLHEGFSMRNISRVTGISRKAITKIVRDINAQVNPTKSDRIR